MLIIMRVLPRSSKNMLAWEQRTVTPVDGAANGALVNLLAECLLVPRRTISIVRGKASH